MAKVKLVQKLLVLLILICAKRQNQQVQGIEANSEEEAETANNAHIVYDQRQTGKYNIHVVIKDVAIIEMDQNEISDQNYGDDEYYYDEDDLTVKPLITRPSTIKPLNITTTGKTSTTKTSQESQEFQTSTTVFSNHTISPISNEDNTNRFITSHPPAIHTKSRSKVEPIYAIEEDSLVETKPHSKVEPIYSIEEPVLEPRHNLRDLKYDLLNQAESRDGNNMKVLKNSRIYKVKVHGSRQPHQFMAPAVRCRSYQYRDTKGNCRRRRSPTSAASSGSIL